MLFTNVVMNRSYNKVLFVCFASLICQGSVGASEFINLRSLDVMDSITWISPIRNIEEDGSMIVRITSNQTAIPLFYSKNVPLFDFMDRSGPQFYTLEQLSLNPRLVPRPVFTNRNQKQAVKEQERYLFCDWFSGIWLKDMGGAGHKNPIEKTI